MKTPPPYSVAAMACTVFFSVLPIAAQSVGFVGDAYEGFYLSKLSLATFGWTETVVGDQGFTGLAMSPTSELFGVQVVVSTSASGVVVTPWLVRIDSESSAVEPRGQLALPSPSIYETGLAFDASGRLWLTAEGFLYEVDPSDGSLRLQGDLGQRVFGLAGCGSTLFGVTRPAESGFPVRVLRIDPSDGTVTALGPGTGPDIFMADGAGLDFSSDGRLWAVLHNTSGIGVPALLDFIVEFDPISGEVLQSQHLHELGRGLAIGPPPPVCPGRGVTEVPTLAQWGLVLLGLLLAAGALEQLRGR